MKSLESKIRSDPFAKSLGIHVTRIGKGTATATLRVESHMLNFHGVTHGGVVFSLADAAFAAASNSHGTTALALNIEISFRRPGLPGDLLTAAASEESRGEKSALYHLKVTNQDKKVVAVGHGTVFRTGRRF